jgi:hypothetical protein
MTYLKSVLAGMVAVLAAVTGERGDRVGSSLCCKTVDLFFGRRDISSWFALGISWREFKVTHSPLIGSGYFEFCLNSFATTLPRRK